MITMITVFNTLGIAGAEEEANFEITLTDAQIQQLIDLVRQLEKLDTSALISKVEGLQETIQNMAETAEKANGFFASVTNFFAKIGDFFANLFG